MTDVKVTKADREAVGRYVRGLGGLEPTISIYEAFARHRQQALEEAARVADAYSDMCADSDRPTTQSAEGAASDIASAIRSLISGDRS